MPHSNGHIYINNSVDPPVGVSIDDIADVLGSARQDIGGLVEYGDVNAFSKVHPQSVNHVAPATATEREDGNYGLSVPEYSNIASLRNTTARWKYEKGSWYRLDDFDDYYHYAPVPVTCPVGGTVVINAVNELGRTSIPFYMLSLGGNRTTNWHYNRALDGTSGMASSDAVPSGYRGYCIAIEDVNTDNNNPLINNDAKFGLALFTGSSSLTYHSSYFCSEYIRNDLTARENDMFLLSSESLPTGSFTAIPCIRLGNPIAEVGQTAELSYVPLCRYPIDTGATYPCRFSLNVGGTDLYSVVALGVAVNATDSPQTRLTTTSSTVYLFVRVTNNSGADSQTSPGDTLPYWAQVPTLTGNVTYGDSTYWHGSRDATSVLVSTVSGQQVVQAFTIPDGGTQTLVFRIDRIWSGTSGDYSKFVESGSTVGIVQHLFYRPSGAGTEFTSGIQPLIEITHG